jgi:ABC-2 type transport system ATP-binding protein
MSLQLISLTRRFGAQLALDGVSIHVRKGDCYGFIGHNGAGKTTAMRIALGLQFPDSGRVIVDGFDAREHPREARARMGGLIEVPGFQPGFDAARNLAWLARLQGLSRADARREAARSIELVGLAHAGAKPVQEYSQGMRQRLGIAQALLGKPSYVLLDEPTNGLDPQGIAEMRVILRNMIDGEGLTVLLSSHQLVEISDLCNRIGVLHHGKLLVEAETRALVAAAPGRFELETSDDRRALALLGSLGVKATAIASGGLALELGHVEARRVSRAIVENGLDLVRFGPKPPTLEEIYLRFARGETIVAPVAADVIPAREPQAPRERRAPSRPVLRVAGYELSRSFAKPSYAVLLALPAACAALAVLLEKRDALANLARVKSGEIASTTDVTAFQTVATAMKTGLPLLALVLAGVASQSLAAELARGTLRNLLLRPVRRAHVVLGKALAGVVASLLAYALLAGAALGASTLAFGFGDLAEILPNGMSFPLVPASDLWPKLWHALAAPLLPLISALGIGFLAGAFARTAAGALGLAFAALFVLDLGRGIARGFGVEPWLHSAYLPSPLGDTSFLHYFSDLAQGISNTSFEYGAPLFAQLGDGPLAHAMSYDIVVPALWIVATFSVAAILLAKRSIP